jgi:hypothetical protein
MLVDSGAIKPDQMDSVPQNVIMQAMGTQPAVKVAMTAVKLFRNDCLVICSDGLSNKVPPSELREVAQDIDDLTDACRQLIDMANERGGEDNITVIIARFDGESLYSASESSSITGSFRALDQGYTSEYFSESDTSEPVDDDQPDADPMQITTMLNVADIARFRSSATAPADDTAQFGSPSTGAEDVDDFSSRPTAERPAVADDDFSTRPTAERPTIESASPPEQNQPATKRKKRGYALIILIALISLLLLGATGFFVYTVYLKPKPPAAPVE